MGEFGETMQMRASKEGITFSVQGDIGTGNVMLKPRESEKPEERVTLTVHEPVTATFALRYLVNFAKAAPLCGTVELGMGPTLHSWSSTTWRVQITDTCNFILRPRSTSELRELRCYDEDCHHELIMGDGLGSVAISHKIGS